MSVYRPPFTRQPQGGLRLDRGNPLARSITHCLPLNGNSCDIVGGAQITRASGYSQVADGRGISARGSGSACASVPINNLAGYTKASVSFWLYWDTFANDDDFAFELGPDINSAAGLFADPNTSSGGSSFEVGSRGTGSGTYGSSTFPRPSAAAWHHYVLVYDLLTSVGVSAVWVDGVSQTLTTVGNAGQVGTLPNATLYLFSRAGTALFGAGRMQNLFIRAGYTMSAAEVAAEYSNPWQVYAPPPRRFFAASAGTGTAALTGVTGTGSVGTVIPNSSVPLTGNTGTGSVGTVVPATSVALTGVTGTGSVGTLGANTTIALTGVAGTGSVGSVSASSPGTAALTGVTGTGSVGTLGPTSTVAITGNSATGSVGTLAPSTIIALTGVSATGSVGTLTASTSGNVTVALTGVSATGSVGTLTPSGGNSGTDTHDGGGPIHPRAAKDYRKRKKLEEEAVERGRAARQADRQEIRELLEAKPAVEVIAETQRETIPSQRETIPPIDDNEADDEEVILFLMRYL